MQSLQIQALLEKASEAESSNRPGDIQLDMQDNYCSNNPSTQSAIKVTIAKYWIDKLLIHQMQNQMQNQMQRAVTQYVAAEKISLQQRLGRDVSFFNSHQAIVWPRVAGRLLSIR